MAGSKRVRRNVEQWREILARQGQSELGVEQFCAQEGLSRSVFNRWRARLKAESQSAPAMNRARAPRATGAFIEVGALASRSASAAATTIRLELGAGMVLTIQR